MGKDDITFSRIANEFRNIEYCINYLVNVSVNIHHHHVYKATNGIAELEETSKTQEASEYQSFITVKPFVRNVDNLHLRRRSRVKPFTPKTTNMIEKMRTAFKEIEEEEGKSDSSSNKTSSEESDSQDSFASDEFFTP